MSTRTTADTIALFNRAFTHREAHLLGDLIAEECVMESVQPAPRGERVVGRDACVRWWSALVEDRGSQFLPREVIVAGERATIVWDYRYGQGAHDWVSGVNVMRVVEGRIVEALGFSKTAGEVPLASEPATATA